MIKIEVTNKFTKAYKKLPKDIQLIFKKQLDLFVENPKHPSLKTKKNNTASSFFGESIFESRIQKEYRFLWKWNGYQIVLLLTTGAHEIVEGKK